MKLFPILNFLMKLCGISLFSHNYSQTRIDNESKSALDSTGRIRIFNIAYIMLLLVVYLFFFVSSVFHRNDSNGFAFTVNYIQLVPNSLAYIISLLSSLINHNLTVAIESSISMSILPKIRALQKIYQPAPIHAQNEACFIKHVARTFFIRSIFVTTNLIVISSVLLFTTYKIGVNYSQLWTIYYWLIFCIAKVTLSLVILEFSGFIVFLKECVRFTEIMLCHNLVNTSDMRIIASVGNHNANLLLNDVAVLSNEVQSTADSVNQLYGKKFIFIILSSFLTVTIQLTYAINQIRYGNTSDLSFLLLTMTVAILALHVFEFFIIFYSGQVFRGQWDSFVYTLNVINENFIKDLVASGNSGSGGSLNNNHAVDRICNFIEIIKLRRTSFDANGLFVIDFSMITGLLSAIATYLIVLVQFKLSEEGQINGGALKNQMDQTYQVGFGSE